ncbi:MAG: hypothetical protein HYW62_03760 [Candidatus Levybacteria bacterium]|nr:hypothetical protein [Candidatus Levybacteria bacterium]
MSLPFPRFAIFVIYFWFGFLKLIDSSPANPLVESLLNKTLPFISFSQFIIFLGLWEMIIGTIFLIPKLERVAITILVLHMATTFMPLFILPSIAWTGFLVPTLEGQYMIKNIITLALAVNIVSQAKSNNK